MSTRRILALFFLCVIPGCGPTPPEPKPEPPSLLGIWELEDSLVTTSTWGTLVDVRMQIDRVDEGPRAAGTFTAFGLGNDSTALGGIRRLEYNDPAVRFDLEVTAARIRGDLVFTAKFVGTLADSTRIEGRFLAGPRVSADTAVFHLLTEP